MQIRDERPEDADAIRAVTEVAFADMPYASGTEAEIVERLRADDALALSLVAEDDGQIVGHIAFSPVTVDGADAGWFGVGPVSVRPDRQKAGIGSALMRQGLAMLKARGAQGCALVGDPAYYARFGFVPGGGLTMTDLPPEYRKYFQTLALAEPSAAGNVAFHPAFQPDIEQIPDSGNRSADPSRD